MQAEDSDLFSNEHVTEGCMMSSNDVATSVARTIRGMRIAVGVLTMGLVAFLAIVLLIVAPTQNANQKPTEAVFASLPLLTCIAFLVAAVALVVSVVIPNLLVRLLWRFAARPGGETMTSTQREDTAKLGCVYATQLLVGTALAEFAGFLALIAYLIEGHRAALFLAVALIVVVALRFPTRGRLSRWMMSHLSRPTQQEEN
jgi:hypothetical protein